jgi:DNA replication protein DnaC
MTNWLEEQVKPKQVLGPNEIPRRYQEVTLDIVTHPSLVKAARKYGAEFWDAAPRGLAPLFLGGAGEYKTVTAAVIAQKVRNAGIEVVWVNCAGEFTKFDREAFDPDTKKRLEKIKTTPFLVLDDFAQIPTGSRMINTLVEIGTQRYDNMLPTLYTGNLVISKGDTSKLAAHVGACLERRMLDASEGFRVFVQATTRGK